jgi:hypothetical protein
LLNSLHLAAIQCFFKEVRDQHEENGEKGETKDSTFHSNDALL